MVGAYAWSTGSAVNAFTGAVFAAGAVGLLVFECALAPMAGRARAAGDLAGAAGYLATLAVVLPVVCSLDVGFVSTTFSDARAHRAVVAVDTAAVPRRSAAEVRAEVNAILLDRKLGDCTVVNGPATREKCPRVAELRIELANAEAFEAKTAAGEPVGEVDARADLLARRTTLDASAWADALTLLTALAFGFARVAGSYHVFGHAPRPAPVVATALPRQEAPRSAVVVQLERHRPRGFLADQWFEVRQREIADGLGLSLSRANKALKEAAEAGLIGLDTSTGKTRVRLGG